jgi:KDO2-lipid IV(A) lauroyltransferase
MSMVFRFLALWPLPLLHLVGVLGGWCVWLASPGYRRRWSHNTRQAGVHGWARWRSIGEAGKQVAELPRLWFGAPVKVGWEGAASIEAALHQGCGMVFLTPHLGCFEITAQAYAQRFAQHEAPDNRPITVLFRPPRQAALRPVMEAARMRPGMRAAPATLSGVKQLMQALRGGEAIGLLPDQVPPEGMGIWAPFFGKPAYTMTLSLRFIRAPGVRTWVAWGERLSWGRGFVVHVHPLEEVLGGTLSDNQDTAVAQINQSMENVIRKCPQQYAWGYARYKAPRKGMHA